MENASDALDFDLYVDEKKREAVSLYFRLVVLTDKTALGIVKPVGNQDGFEAYRRLAVRYAPRTLGRNLTRLTSIIDHDFGTDETQMLDKIASWERQIEEHERISGEKIADSVKCAVIQKGMPAALRTYLLVNSPNASDWTAMRRSIQSYLLATASTPKPVPMDVGYIPKG
eukprot:397420-Amphidinium_carterae.1